MDQLNSLLESQKGLVDPSAHKFRQLSQVLAAVPSSSQAFEVCLQLAREAPNRDALREHGVIPPLLKGLSSESPEFVRITAHSLAFLSENEKARDAIRSENGIKPICNVLRTTTDVPTQDLLLTTLTALCTSHPASVEVVVSEKMVSVLASLLAHQQLQQRALFTLAKLAGSVNALREAKPSGLIANLAKLIAVPKLRDNAIILLFNLSQLDVNREEIAAQSCPALTSLVSASATLEPATWQRILQLLYNVSVDAGARLKVRESDLLQHVVKCLANPNAQLVNLAAGALASYNAPEEAELLSKHSALVGLLNAWAAHEALRPSLLLTLANILAYEPNQEQFVELKGGPLIASALSLPSSPAKAAAARAVSNVSAVHDFVRSHLCESGVLSLLLPLLKSPEADVRRQAARAVTNLALSQRVGEELVRLNGIEQVLASLNAPETSGDAPTRARLAGVLVNVSASVPSARSRIRKCGVVAMATGWLSNSGGSVSADLQMASAKLLMNLSVSGLIRKDIVTSNLKSELERAAKSQSNNSIGEILEQVLRNLSFPYDANEIEKEDDSLLQAAAETRLEELKKEAERKRVEAEAAEKKRIGEEEFRRKQEEAARHRLAEEQRQKEAAELAAKIAAQKREEEEAEAKRLAEAVALEKLIERARRLEEEQERLMKLTAVPLTVSLSATPVPSLALPTAEEDRTVSTVPAPVTSVTVPAAPPVSLPEPAVIPVKTPAETTTPTTSASPTVVIESAATPSPPVKVTEVTAVAPSPPVTTEASVPTSVPPIPPVSVTETSATAPSLPPKSVITIAQTPVTPVEAAPAVTLPSPAVTHVSVVTSASPPPQPLAPQQMTNEQLIAAMAERRRQLEELRAERERVDAEVRAAQEKKGAAKEAAREEKRKRKAEKETLKAQKRQQEEEAARLQREAQAKLKADATARAAAQEVRTRIAQELHETERNYVKQLQLLLKKYQEPWMALEGTKQALCTSAQIKAIFSNTASLYNLHQLLLEAISARVVRDWNENTKIGDIFLKFIDLLNIYAEYINGYDEAHRIVKELLETSVPFAKFCRRAELDPEAAHMDIESLLITPVQRMPRYEMLLSTLYKHTWQGHPDYDTLFEAMLKMKECVDSVNEKKRRYEETQRLFSVLRSVTGHKFDSGELFGPGRRVVREGELKFSAALSKTKPGHYFLLNDTLLLTSLKTKKKAAGATSSSFKYKGHISLFSIKVEEMEKTLLSVTDSAKGYSKVLSFESAEERSKFHFMIKDAIKQLFTRPSSVRLTAPAARMSTKLHP